MKALLLSLILSLGLFASTTYKSPAFIVENSELYCTDYYGETITVKPVGDIITGDYASSYCGYSLEVAKSKQSYQASHHSKESDKLFKFFLGFLILALFLGLLTIVYNMSQILKEN